MLMFQWTDPTPHLTSRYAPAPPRYLPRHARPGITRRSVRAAIRGAARATAWALWPGYITYTHLEVTYR